MASPTSQSTPRPAAHAAVGLPKHPKLSLELRLTPRADRDDAAQEAWLAKLEGRNPARAVATYAQRERRRRKRERLATDCGLAALSMN